MMMTPYPGTLISLEGIDGAGKSTVIDHLAAEFSDVTITREPSHHWTGDQVYRSIRHESGDDAPPLGTFFLYLADRAKHLSDTVIPRLEAGETVITDRYIDSTYAYQQYALRNDISQPLRYIQEVMRDWIVIPDITLYLDISVDTALDRSAGEDDFETREFLTEVKQNYDTLYETGGNRWVRLDAEQPADDVADAATAVIAGRKVEYDGVSPHGIARNE